MLLVIYLYSTGFYGQYLVYREQEEEGDAEQELAVEKDIAAQRLWQSFQESATAVAHLFRG